MSLSTITRKDMGMSMSAAVRRLVLIGARCEAEHGRSTMPASYNDLHTGSKEFNDEFYGEREEAAQILLAIARFGTTGLKTCRTLLPTLIIRE